MILQETKLRCPHCGCDTPREYTEDTCALCGRYMEEYKQCKCCGEFRIPENECEEYCQTCKDTAHKKLYDFLKSKFSEKEIDLLDETADKSFYHFLKDYEEEHYAE